MEGKNFVNNSSSLGNESFLWHRKWSKEKRKANPSIFVGLLDNVRSIYFIKFPNRNTILLCFSHDAGFHFGFRVEKRLGMHLDILWDICIKMRITLFCLVEEGEKVGHLVGSDSLYLKIEGREEGYQELSPLV